MRKVPITATRGRMPWKVKLAGVSAAVIATFGGFHAWQNARDHGRVQAMIDVINASPDAKGNGANIGDRTVRRNAVLYAAIAASAMAEKAGLLEKGMLAGKSTGQVAAESLATVRMEAKFAPGIRASVCKQSAQAYCAMGAAQIMPKTAFSAAIQKSVRGEVPAEINTAEFTRTIKGIFESALTSVHNEVALNQGGAAVAADALRIAQTNRKAAQIRLSSLAKAIKAATTPELKKPLQTKVADERRNIATYNKTITVNDAARRKYKTKISDLNRAADRYRREYVKWQRHQDDTNPAVLSAIYERGSESYRRDFRALYLHDASGGARDKLDFSHFETTTDMNVVRNVYDAIWLESHYRLPENERDYLMKKYDPRIWRYLAHQGGPGTMRQIAAAVYAFDNAKTVVEKNAARRHYTAALNRAEPRQNPYLLKSVKEKRGRWGYTYDQLREFPDVIKEVATLQGWDSMEKMQRGIETFLTSPYLSKACLVPKEGDPGRVMLGHRPQPGQPYLCRNGQLKPKPVS